MISKVKAVLCLDIDGTLTDQNEKIHLKDVEILQAFPEPLQPVLATGRHLASAKRILAANHVFENTAIPLPSIFMNGGASYLPNEELLIEHNFPPETLITLIELSKSYPETTFGFFTISSAYLVNPTNYGHHISEIHYLSSQDVNEKTLPKKIIKMMVIEQDKKILKQIETKGAEINAEMAYSLPHLIEFTPLGINKAVGLPPLLHEMSLKDLPIYTAGDGQNDLGLFELAVKSFAPSYAHPAILNKADHIIQRENEGMLAPIIERIFQIR